MELVPRTKQSCLRRSESVGWFALCHGGYGHIADGIGAGLAVRTTVCAGRAEARELLAYLAVHTDGATGERISADLWPDLSPRDAASQRKLALRKAREMLRTATGLPAPMFITLTGDRYRLDTDLISADLQQFDADLDRATAATSEQDHLTAGLSGSGSAGHLVLYLYARYSRSTTFRAAAPFAPQRHKALGRSVQRQESTGYQHDVFVSYLRANEWETFVGKHFMPMFRLWLDTALGRSSDIFVDQEAIRSGEAWPHRLANGVARSKIMVCLWTRQYFSSSWCVTELALMMARKRLLQASYGPLPLIIAAPIHDTEDPDPRVADIQQFGLQKWANPWLAEGSVNTERLAIEIRRLAEDVAYALAQVPAYDPTWRDLATDEFMRLLKHPESQRLPPSLGQTA